MENKLTKSVSIHQQEEYSPQILDLLKNTLWGTPGKTLYRHLDTSKTINHIISPQFFSLHRFDKLLCTVCLSEREINLDGEKVKSKYVCYLAANPAISGNGQRNKSERFNEPNGIIKVFMKDVFSKGALPDPFEPERQKAFFYAYVESDNEQSLHLCSSFGLRSVRKLTTLAFSRFYPKKFESVRRAKIEEYDQVRQKITQYYSNHNFRCLDYIFYDDNYFVAEADGKIVAGVQANPISWSFKNLPGLSGKVLLKVLPHVPLLRRLINPGKFEFSAFEGIFCEKGYEWILNELFESVLFHQERNTALIWLDVDCPVLKTIRKHCSLGLMDVINSNGSGEILVRGDGLNESDWETLAQKPMYISCFDMN